MTVRPVHRARSLGHLSPWISPFGEVIEHNKATIRRLIEEILNGGHLELIDKLSPLFSHPRRLQQLGLA